jgi:hypothetical protein
MRDIVTQCKHLQMHHTFTVVTVHVLLLRRGACLYFFGQTYACDQRRKREASTRGAASACNLPTFTVNVKGSRASAGMAQ